MADSMTAQEMCLDLLRYVGVTGFSPVENDQKLNRPGLDADDIRKAIAAINSALQTIQKWGPQDLKQGERAAFYNDPTTIELSVLSQFGRSAIATTIPPSWMLGCSILISGDNDINRIMDITGDELSLLRGYRGATGTGTATVYADCATLDDDIGAVLEPVRGTPNLKLVPARDIAWFERCWRSAWYDNAYVSAAYNAPGVPRYYIIERRRNGELFLRVTPRPGVAMNATFQAKLRAERIDQDVIDTTGGGDPGYEFESLHADEVESLLLPIARWRFFSHPALKNAEGAARVKLEYDEAMMTLKAGTPLEASVHDNRVTYI